jgi:hypothetical protein
MACTLRAEGDRNAALQRPSGRKPDHRRCIPVRAQCATLPLRTGPGLELTLQQVVDQSELLEFVE